MTTMSAHQCSDRLRGWHWTVSFSNQLVGNDMGSDLCKDSVSMSNPMSVEIARSHALTKPASEKLLSI